jgi:hypothetical protein
MSLDIPAFLQIPQSERREAWKGRRLTVQGSNFKNKLTKTEEAATKQLRREIAAAEEEKKAARFAALKEMHEEKKRLRK